MMKRAIFQVAVGPQSKLYKHCVASVNDYAKEIGADHLVQKQPLLWIKPDPFTGQRSKESYEKYGGFLPIFEKENVFATFKDYDQVAVIDADIYIRPDSPNVFDTISADCHFGAQFERDLLIERTQSGLARAKASGKPLGRPSALSAGQQAEVKEKLKNGETISAIARQFETSRQTIMRVRDHA